MPILEPETTPSTLKSPKRVRDSHLKLPKKPWPDTSKMSPTEKAAYILKVLQEYYDSHTEEDIEENERIMAEIDRNRGPGREIFNVPPELSGK